MDNETLYAEELEMEVPDHALKTLKRLWHSAEELRLRLVFVLVSVVFYTALSILSPLYSAYIVDLIWDGVKEAVTQGTTFQIAWEHGGLEILMLLGIYTVTWLFYTLQNFLMAGFAEKLNLKLRSQISQKLTRLPLSYFDNHQPGEILSRATNDLDKMSEAMQMGLLKLFTSVGLVLGSVIMMFRFNLWLTLIFLVFTGLSMLLTKFFSRKTLESAAKRQKCMSNLTSYVEEAYSGRVIIRSFNNETISAAQMYQVTDELAESASKADFLVNAINPAIRFVNRLGQVLIAVFAGKLLIDGSLTVGTIQAFFQYVYQASEPLTEASYMINSMQSALASVEHIYKMLDEPEISPDPEMPAVVENAEGTVSFQHVRFGYTPEHLLMQDICFTAQPGQKIAIVGNTGAGKTTLINLLMRFYEVNGGKILLDGVDTKTMTRAALRSNFGMVLQDTWLFEGTIAENIAYGKPDATEEEIIEAAKCANIHDFIMELPDQYDTFVGERGARLSGGQKQRISIARVFLKNPPILILDEATSALDNESERWIQHSLEELSKNRTTITIAHRLSTIKNADEIIVITENGIAERGTHETLLEKNGIYAGYYNMA